MTFVQYTSTATGSQKGVKEGAFLKVVVVVVVMLVIVVWKYLLHRQ